MVPAANVCCNVPMATRSDAHVINRGSAERSVTALIKDVVRLALWYQLRADQRGAYVISVDDS